LGTTMQVIAPIDDAMQTEVGPMILLEPTARGTVCSFDHCGGGLCAEAPRWFRWEGPVELSAMLGDERDEAPSVADARRHLIATALQAGTALPPSP
jgi:hypothetical protein